MIRSLQPTDHTSLLDVQRRAYKIEARLLETADFPPLRETIDDINIEAPVMLSTITSLVPSRLTL